MPVPAIPIVIPFAFATQQGQVPASELDADFQVLAAAANAPETYTNPANDIGTQNHLVIQPAKVPTFPFTKGLSFVISPAFSNSGAVDLQVQASGGGAIGGVIAIQRPNLQGLSQGDIVSGSEVFVIFNGSVWILQTFISQSFSKNPGPSSFFWI